MVLYTLWPLLARGILKVFENDGPDDFSLNSCAFAEFSEKLLSPIWHKLSSNINSFEDDFYEYLALIIGGVVFKKKYIEDIDSSRFRNLNYFQVYLFCLMIYKYGAKYFKKPMIVCVGDGENAYGISKSSGGNKLLADRRNVKSNLEFNKTLIKTIKMFDEDYNTSIFLSFEKQYSLHSYTGLSIARANSIRFYNEYWDILKSLDIRLYPIAYVYYFILLVFGSKFCNIVLKDIRKYMKRVS